MNHIMTTHTKIDQLIIFDYS